MDTSTSPLLNPKTKSDDLSAIRDALNNLLQEINKLGQTQETPLERQVLRITTAYEQGVGKALKHSKAFCPYLKDSAEAIAWEQGRASVRITSPLPAIASTPREETVRTAEAVVNQQITPTPLIMAPAGYRLLPERATSEMRLAANRVEDLYKRGTPEVWSDVYEAMINAAPSRPMSDLCIIQPLTEEQVLDNSGLRQVLRKCDLEVEHFMEIVRAVEAAQRKA